MQLESLFGTLSFAKAVIADALNNFKMLPLIRLKTKKSPLHFTSGFPFLDMSA